MRKTVITAIMLTMASAASAQSPPPGCAGEGYGQFDFWLGEWDVFPAQADKTLIAHSKVEKLYSNCAVRENWMPLKGGGGGSLNNYDAETGQWRQLWLGSVPGRVDLTGGLVDGKMVLTGFVRNANGPGKHALSRMTFSKQADGSVRQLGEQSTDHGLTWTSSFDFIYRKAKAE